MYEADAQHQDELLKQERLMVILKNIWEIKMISSDDILFLASAIGLSKEFTKYVTGVRGQSYDR